MREVLGEDCVLEFAELEVVRVVRENVEMMKRVFIGA